MEALGVTDYFCIGTYREVRRRVADGVLPNVGLLFPNVEMRLNIGTDRNKGVNLHLLFSPDDPGHEEEIERLLSHLTFEFDGRKYSCTRDDLVRLGRAFDANVWDDLAALRAGANQFKAGLSDVRELCRDKWFRKYGLVAVAGSEADGTSGLQHDASMAATRLEIERLADINLWVPLNSGATGWKATRPRPRRYRGTLRIAEAVSAGVGCAPNRDRRHRAGGSVLLDQGRSRLRKSATGCART